MAEDKTAIGAETTYFCTTDGFIFAVFTNTQERSWVVD